MSYSTNALIPGANPSYSGVNNSAPINGSAQGMPAPKQFGSYTKGPNTNSLGSWGGAAESSGIPGDPYSPVGAPTNPSMSATGKRGGGGGKKAGNGWAAGGTASNPYDVGEYTNSNGMKGSGNFYGSSPMETSMAGLQAWDQNFEANNPSAAGYPQMAGNGYSLASEDGGPIPAIKHTSKKAKGYDDGGSVSDDNSDDQTSGAQDDSDTASGSIDPAAGSYSAQGSGEQSDSDALMASVYKTLDYGRQKYGISNDLINEVYPQSSFASGADQMRPSTNVEDDRQGGGSIDTSLPTTKADANQVLPNINGHSAGPTPPWPYNGSGQVLTAIPDNSENQ